jgi:hypothetical protein
MQRFTDNDIQDYLEGLFYGDTRSLEAYLHDTEEGKKRLQYFQSMFEALQEGPVPSLNISLEQSVMAALEPKKGFNWNYVLWTITGICIVAALTACFIYMEDLSFFSQISATAITPLAIVALVLLTLAFHGVDLYRRYSRYKKLFL